MNRIYVVYECENDPNNPHNTISSYKKVFVNEERMLQYIDEQYKQKMQHWKDIDATEIKSIYDDPDQYVIYAKDKDNNTLYYEISYEGNVPVVFDYDNDWKILNNKEKLPIRDIPDKIYIVKQDMGVPGGCLPDLPDSVYVNIEDAYRRIKELFDDTVYSWKTLSNFEIIKDLPNDKSLQAEEHYYFRTYLIENIDVVK